MPKVLTKAKFQTPISPVLLVGFLKSKSESTACLVREEEWMDNTVDFVPSFGILIAREN